MTDLPLESWVQVPEAAEVYEGFDYRLLKCRLRLLHREEMTIDVSTIAGLLKQLLTQNNVSCLLCNSVPDSPAWALALSSQRRGFALK